MIYVIKCYALGAERDVNYLAHLHLAYVTSTSLEGALMGDFVKGKNLDAYSDEQRIAIRLHRKIDRFTEDSSVIQAAKRSFRSENRRFSGIALDVFWDHCLALDLVEQGKIRHFLSFVYETLETKEPTFVTSFEELRAAILEYRWFESFTEFAAVERTLARITQRKPRMSHLLQCVGDLEENYEALKGRFVSFYPELSGASKQWVDELRG
ncbi:MAG: ACP phosphodiesterase [Myxococcota bacterium]|nr:ACP phosphodiesterase [Myxococcota bacterium]